MLSIRELRRLSAVYHVPVEDVFFIAFNKYGIKRGVAYNRMRTLFRLADTELFPNARERREHEFYLALPVTAESPFSEEEGNVYLDGVMVGQMVDPTEDICDSNYPRRNGTSLNINPHSRTSCRGCEFCYTAYQVPQDLRMLVSEDDLREFFDGWLQSHGLQDLSHLIQVSGCHTEGS